VNRDEFVEFAKRPEFGETMNFQVVRNQPGDETFSAEAIEDVSRQIAMFIAARAISRWETTGEVPRFVSARVTVDWDQRIDDEPGAPWYRGQEGEPPEGANRWQKRRRQR
jgi:hypothetical protein